MDYEKMLKEAKKMLPDSEDAFERFQTPTVKGHIQGNKTIMTNFIEITKILRRSPNHVLKFLNKELASKGELKNNQIIFNTKIPSEKINQKIQKYTENYVLCKECTKPDTSIDTSDAITFLRCHACGAKYSIQTKN